MDFFRECRLWWRMFAYLMAGMGYYCCGCKMPSAQCQCDHGSWFEPDHGGEG